MENIPSVYWMILIGAVTFFICFVLYQFAMLLKESTGAVKDSRKIIRDTEKLIENANSIVAEATIIVQTLKGTVLQINKSVLGPVKRIGSVLGLAESFSKGLKAGRKS